MALCQKDLPTQLEGGLNFTQMPVVKVGDQSLEPQIGADPTPDS